MWDGFGPPQHFGDRQILYHDQVVGGEESADGLVLNVAPLVGDFAVPRGHRLTAPAPVIRSRLAGSATAARPCRQPREPTAVARTGIEPAGDRPGGPHLHFQLADGPEITTSNSLPFSLDSYWLAGVVDPAQLDAAFGPRGGISPTLTVTGPGRQESTIYLSIYLSPRSW